LATTIILVCLVTSTALTGHIYISTYLMPLGPTHLTLLRFYILW